MNYRPKINAIALSEAIIFYNPYAFNNLLVISPNVFGISTLKIVLIIAKSKTKIIKKRYGFKYFISLRKVPLKSFGFSYLLPALYHAHVHVLASLQSHLLAVYCWKTYRLGKCLILPYKFKKS